MFWSSQFSLVGIGRPDRPPSKQCGGWWAVGGGSWVKKKLVGRKIFSVVKLMDEIWWVVGREWWVVLSLLAQFLPGFFHPPHNYNESSGRKYGTSLTTFQKHKALLPFFFFWIIFRLFF